VRLFAMPTYYCGYIKNMNNVTSYSIFGLS
jgi:hypothetical protein